MTLRGSPLHWLLVGVIAVTHCANGQLTEPTRTARERYETAVLLLGAGEYERATEALREIIVDYPDFQRAYRSLERAYVILGDDEGATVFSRSESPRLPTTRWPTMGWVSSSIPKTGPSST